MVRLGQENLLKDESDNAAISNLKGVPVQDSIDEASVLHLIARLNRHRKIPDCADDQLFMGPKSRLREVFEAYQAALNQHAIVAITDRRGRIIYANDKFCSVSGYSLAELVDKPHRIVNSGYHPKSFFTAMWQTIARAERWRGEICNRSKSGLIYWVDTTIVPIIDDEGRIYAYVSIRYDITDRKEAEIAILQEVEKRRQAEMLLRELIETIPDGIAAFDPADRLVLCNQAYLNLYQHSSAAITVGATFDSILRCGMDNGQYVLQRSGAEAREAWYRARLKDHQEPGKISVQELSGGRWVLANDRRSSSGYTIGSRTDISELKRSEALAKFNAEHDPLTKLYNRLVLERRLRQAIEASRRTGAEGALIVIDLDGFKAVNDSMGHAAGDALLVAVGQRMQAALRKTDTAIRLGGDEFAVILPRLRRADVKRFAARLINILTQPVAHQGQEIKPRLSMGVAFFTRDGSTTETLLRKADIALYQAKMDGCSSTRVFSKAMRVRDDRRRKQAAALVAAIASDRIEIALQPQFQLSDRSHSGFEALARWQNAGQNVPPSDFIPIAEECGLIVDLGFRVIDRAFAAAREMKQAGLDFGRIAVNVAAAQLRMPEFPERVRSLAASHGLRPRDFELELTENILLDAEQKHIAESLRQLRDMGFSVALDDFGTGYASLAHLSRFPVNKIKIDRSFVHNMQNNTGVFTIVRAMVGLAHSLSLDVIAEGIETSDQLHELIGMECRFGQGYLESRPLKPADAMEFLRAKCGPNLSPHRCGPVGKGG